MGIWQGERDLTLLSHRLTGPPDASPLFLLNGGLMTMAAWEKVVAPLEDAFRIVRCDFRGQLFSPGIPEPRLQPHAEDLVALLDQLVGEEPPDVAGRAGDEDGHAPTSLAWWDDAVRYRRGL